MLEFIVPKYYIENGEKSILITELIQTIEHVT